jgi:hypothetical protein
MPQPATPLVPVFGLNQFWADMIDVIRLSNEEKIDRRDVPVLYDS